MLGIEPVSLLPPRELRETQYRPCLHTPLAQVHAHVREPGEIAKCERDGATEPVGCEVAAAGNETLSEGDFGTARAACTHMDTNPVSFPTLVGMPPVSWLLSRKLWRGISRHGGCAGSHREGALGRTVCEAESGFRCPWGACRSADLNRDFWKIEGCQHSSASTQMRIAERTETTAG